MPWTTNTTPLCINCGFVGATFWINNIGPYCGKCAKQASGSCRPGGAS